MPNWSPKYRSAALLPVLAAAALTAAGCGGGGPPSQEEFAKDLDAICKRASVKIQRLPRPQTLKEIAAFPGKSRPILEESVKEAEALELPDEKRSEFEAYLVSSRRSLSALGEMERAAEDKSGRAIRRVFTRTAAENKRRAAQAKKLGLKQCGAGL